MSGVQYILREQPLSSLTVVLENQPKQGAIRMFLAKVGWVEALWHSSIWKFGACMSVNEVSGHHGWVVTSLDC